MSTQPLPYAHLGEALATDYFHVRDRFTDEQWENFIATRRFVDNEVLPQITHYWEAAEPPWPLMRRLPGLGLLGEDIQGYMARTRSRSRRPHAATAMRGSCTAPRAGSATPPLPM